MTLSIDATPFAYPFEVAKTAFVIIDMQRDFIEPGGFGATLGNDVTLLQAIVPTTAKLIAGARAAGIPVIHTRECHAPDLSDCPPAKRLRGKPSMRIGDPGPMGRILIAGEPGAGIVPELAPIDGEIVAVNQKLVDNPGLVNEDPTGTAWFFKMKIDDLAVLNDFMDEDEYNELIG